MHQIFRLHSAFVHQGLASVFQPNIFVKPGELVINQ